MMPPPLGRKNYSFSSASAALLVRASMMPPPLGRKNIYTNVCNLLRSQAGFNDAAPIGAEERGAAAVRVRHHCGASMMPPPLGRKNAAGRIAACLGRQLASMMPPPLGRKNFVRPGRLQGLWSLLQ